MANLRCMNGEVFKHVLEDLRGRPFVTINDDRVFQLDHGDAEWPDRLESKFLVRNLLAYRDAQLDMAIGYFCYKIMVRFPNLQRLGYWEDKDWNQPNRPIIIKESSTELHTEFSTGLSTEALYAGFEPSYKRWKAKVARVDRLNKETKEKIEQERAKLNVQHQGNV